MVRFSEIEPFGYEDKLVSHGDQTQMIYASGSENPGSSSEAASFAQHDQVCLPAKLAPPPELPASESFGPAAPATRAERTTGMVRFSEIWEREPGQ
jgi:hypothetical protein